METLAEPRLRDEIESLLTWWADAGVDTMIDEAPNTTWLSSPEPAARRPGGAVEVRPEQRAPPEPMAVVPATLSLPVTLEGFVDWMASDMTVLGPYPARNRLVAEGSAHADLMIVTDIPEREDAAQGRLLTGEVGGLFDKMLAAMKIERSTVYLASVAPGRPPGGLLSDAEADRLAPLLRRHIQLVAPKRLWLMGRAASRAILGMDEAKAGGKLHTVNSEDVMVTAIATLHPRVLLKEPKSKARVWADMQRLIGADG